MKTIELDDDFAREVAISLYCRTGLIETGHPMLTANDAMEQGHPEWIKPLNDEQKELIIKMNKLAKALGM